MSFHQVEDGNVSFPNVTFSTFQTLFARGRCAFTPVAQVYEEGSKGLRRAARIWSGAYPLKAVGFALAEAFGVAVDAFHEHPCKEAQALPTGSPGPPQVPKP